MPKQIKAADFADIHVVDLRHRKGKTSILKLGARWDGQGSWAALGHIRAECTIAGHVQIVKEQVKYKSDGGAEGIRWDDLAEPQTVNRFEIAAKCVRVELAHHKTGSVYTLSFELGRITGDQSAGLGVFRQLANVDDPSTKASIVIARGDVENVFEIEPGDQLNLWDDVAETMVEDADAQAAEG